MKSSRFSRSAIALTTLALAAAALAAPVAAQSPSAPAQTGAGKTIFIVSPDYAAQPAAKEAIDQFVAAAEARGYTTDLVDTASDNAAINGEITTAVSQGVDAIVTAFGSPQEFGEGLAAAGAAGVPVFGLDTGGVVEPTLVNVTTDNKYLGEASAKAIIDALGGTGKVAIINFDPFEPVRLRAEAARAAFAAATDDTARRAAAETVHRRAAEDGFYMPLGQFVTPSAWRSDLTEVPTGPAMFLWNIRRGR